MDRQPNDLLTDFELRRRLEANTRELDAMPAWKKGTAWRTDRLHDRMMLLGALACMKARCSASIDCDIDPDRLPNPDRFPHPDGDSDWELLEPLALTSGEDLADLHHFERQPQPPGETLSLNALGSLFHRALGYRP